MSLQPGTYILTNVKSGTVLDLAADGSISGWKRHGGTNQQAGVVSEGTFENGTPLRAVPYAFAWDIFRDAIDQTVNRITVPGSQYSVDLTNNGNATDGTLVTLWLKWEGINQTWRFDNGE
ncbi:hypothetical protein DXG01_001931 [Tephrocybe rancida]|nr:hypothetical protein DXG01_001931 [Tephrocybe rancida]